MAWPPPTQPNTFANETLQVDAHPLAHNDIANTLNLDFAPQVSANLADIAAQQASFVAGDLPRVAGDLKVDGAIRASSLTAGTNQLLLDGNGVRVATNLEVDGQIQAQNGRNFAPAYSFASDPDTGIYRYGEGILSICGNSTIAANFGADGVSFPNIKTTSTQPPNVHVNSFGEVFRSTATRFVDE